MAMSAPPLRIAVIFIWERLQAAIGIERCAFWMPFVQPTLTCDSRLRTVIGAGDQKTIMSQQRCVDVFTAAGSPSGLERDMPLWHALTFHRVWCKKSISVADEDRRC